MDDYFANWWTQIEADADAMSPELKGLVEKIVNQPPDTRSESEKVQVFVNFVCAKLFCLSKTMRISELKITTWQDSEMVVLRVEHDVENGTAIAITSRSLADALIEMGHRLKQGSFQVCEPSSIWEEEAIRGE